MLVYDKEMERTLRARKTAFETACRQAGHDWHEIDVSDAFASWMSSDEYREEYFGSPEDLQLLAVHGSHVAHCPISNMYLGNGIAPVPAMLDQGVNVALGTDGAASNNNQDMFAVMKTASLLQKVAHLDPAAMAPGTVLEMATLHGARAMQVDAGILEPGRLADLVVVDLSGAHNQPLHRPVSALVYSAHAEDVESVVVGGRVVLRNRQFETLPEREILAEASRRAQALLERTGVLADLPLRWPWS